MFDFDFFAFLSLCRKLSAMSTQLAELQARCQKQHETIEILEQNEAKNQVLNFFSHLVLIFPVQAHAESQVSELRAALEHLEREKRQLKDDCDSQIKNVIDQAGSFEHENKALLAVVDTKNQAIGAMGRNSKSLTIRLAEELKMEACKLRSEVSDKAAMLAQCKKPEERFQFVDCLKQVRGLSEARCTTIIMPLATEHRRGKQIVRRGERAHG